MGGTGSKCKSLVLKIVLVDAIVKGTKMLAESVHRIHITNMEMEGRLCTVVDGCKPSALKYFVNSLLNHRQHFLSQMDVFECVVHPKGIISFVWESCVV